MKNKYNNRLGIVIIGYNNITGIRRLLDSLNRVQFGDDELILIFSIDYSGNDNVKQIAEEYVWNHGKKVVNVFDKNLGLRTHILKCGDYLEDYDLDALIVLEDDLYLSPNAYLYALETVNFYKEKEYVAGISLYKHEFNLNAKHPFVDYQDGYDTYFMQYAQSWGQIWLRKQWNDFKEWYLQDEWKKLDQRIVPDNLKKWTNSWLKFHIMYCIAKNKYFVYPRVALSTDYSDVGVHGTRQNTDMQVSLDYANTKEWKLADIENSHAVYDAYYQNTIINSRLNYENVLIDYYGIREIPEGYKYLLTTKPRGYRVERSWGVQLRPIEANIFQDIPGDELFLFDLSKKENLRKTDWKNKIFEYDLKGINIVQISNFVYCTRFLTHYISNKYRRFIKKLKIRK
ncbi:glycosyltransferase family 2 protein [Enterococcus cecorum]|nr:glycosyltransferase family 2 protein [Enterococcus cecorum]CAI3497923.1 glycosyltransferase family 2 protein [Enterococcus cecorum]